MSWIQNEISSGFQRLFCLSLDHTPSAEMVAGTVAAWMEALIPSRGWSERRDVPLMREAFRRLGESCTSWPAPKLFLEHLNALTPLETFRALPRPTKTPEEWREQLNANRDVQQLRRHFGMDRS